jgi:hypothetical protein
MRTNVEIPELLGILKASKKPLSAEQIAKKADTIRNRVTPFLKKLVTTGQVIEVREADQPILFTISESAANELITPIRTKPGKPAAKSATKPAAKTPKATTPKATTATSAQKPGRKPAVKSDSNVHQFERPADKTTVAAATHGTSANVTPIKAPTAEGGNIKLALLRMLVDRDLRKADLQDALGPIDDILDELKKDQLIEQQHIIDSYVYSLTDKAFVVYPELKDKPAVVAAPVAPVAAVAEPQKPAEAPAPAAATPAPATKPAAKKPAVAATAPAAPAPAAPVLPPVLGEISQEISRVVEQIFKDKLDGLVEQLRVQTEEQEVSRKAVAEVSEGILECTEAFQGAIHSLSGAIEALSGLAAKLKKLS